MPTSAGKGGAFGNAIEDNLFSGNSGRNGCEHIPVVGEKVIIIFFKNLAYGKLYAIMPGIGGMV